MSGFRPRFFVPEGVPAVPAGVDAELTGTVITLDAEDSHHALRVLRLHAGDECEVVVGAAVHAATVLSNSGGGGKVMRLQLGARLEGAEAGARYDHLVVLVQALARPSALDWAIEKSTEAGASLILLVQAAGSPRPVGTDAGGRQARWARIAKEAAKQSKQTAVPAVETAASLSSALDRVKGLHLLPLLLEPDADRTLYEMAADARGTSVAGLSTAGVALWVGPESGWTVAERAELEQAGVTPARLGRGVLRTETAGPVGVAVARLALGDW